MPLFKSKLEERVWKILQKEYPSVKYEPDKFKYKQPVVDRTYTPDFYLNDLNKWIEVKGYWYEDAILKYDIFRKKFLDTEIEVWDEIKLKEYNIL